ncbi:MAG: SGNH/GDSL hydrolase family protein [Gemmatales bacterium]|nr:SGNH/GDSL hydrolase family protein [Gemmatales bacterium]MDW8388320.1 GDSL-type esterase/lipase family protein [Gemmatales bacterium]
MPHPVWHHWHQADYRFTYHVPGEGIRRTVTFNEHGMRDSLPRQTARRPGVGRIAVLGDSFVEAMQVEEHEGICKQLEALLSESVPTEVLNFGCSGFSTSLEYLILREWVVRWKPDAVVCLHHFSDITEDWRFRTKAVGAGEDLRAVVPSGSGWGRQVRRVMDASSACRLISLTLQAVRSRPPSHAASLQDGYDAIVNAPYNQQDEVAFAYSLSYLGLMNDLLRQQGIPLVVVVIPLGPQVEPVPVELARRLGLRYLADGQRLEHTGYQEMVRRFCHAHDIAVTDLLDAFQTANPTGKPLLYYSRDQHWTAEGHALAARRIAEELKPLQVGSASRLAVPPRGRKAITCQARASSPPPAASARCR